MIRVLLMLFLTVSIAAVSSVAAQDFPLQYIESLPDRSTKEIPQAHAYTLVQHNSMCVATAVTRAGERMLELEGLPEARHIVAWTHFSGRNVGTVYLPDEIGVYGSDAAQAITKLGFLRWDALPKYDQRRIDEDPLAQLDWDKVDWRAMVKKYGNQTDKYATAEPRTVNEIALCLRKGLPVLFISSAQWKPVRIRDVDGKGGVRVEFGTTQFNTNAFHAVCLRDYYTLPIVKDGQEYPVEYCNLINSHGEPPLPLKMIWLDWIQKDNAFSCFTLLPKGYEK